MNLESVIVGAFYDEEVGKLLDPPGDEQSLYIIPGVGRSYDSSRFSRRTCYLSKLWQNLLLALNLSHWVFPCLFRQQS